MLITIPAESTPTGLVTCTFRRPKYRDRREASRKFPGAQANPGYTLEQLFFAYCLESVNGQQLTEQPHDYMSRLEGFPLEDSQFCIDTFLELFTLNQESAGAAKDEGLRLKQNIAQAYTIGAGSLPGKSSSVTFKAPTLQDNIASNRSVPQGETAFSPEELLLANSIIEIDGKPVTKPSDPIQVLDEFWHEDVQYLLGVFYSMFTLDRPKREAAKSLAKTLKAGMDQTATPTSVKTPSAGVSRTSDATK